MSRIIREAQPSDMAEIMQVMDAAKIIMRHSEAVITADLERNGGFVIEDEGCIVGYFAFLPSPEPTYAKINEGKWIDDTQSYHEARLHLLRHHLSAVWRRKICLSKDGQSLI